MFLSSGEVDVRNAKLMVEWNVPANQKKHM